MKKMMQCYSAKVTINKVDKINMGFCPIIRVPVRNQMEAEEYMKQGAAIYEKIVEKENGSKFRYYFIEVDIYDLAKVARK